MNPFTSLAEQYASEEAQNNYRINRNDTQQKLLLENPAVKVDPVLAGTENDKRMSCCIVSRPDNPTKELILSIQHQLQSSISTEIWLTPPENLHMTLLEVAHSRPEKEIESLVHTLKPKMEAINSITVKGPVLKHPLLCFDANAVALSFTSSYPTHTKLRESLYDFVTHHGVDILPRYAGPSAHITIARFKEQLSTEDVKHMLKTIASINKSMPNHEWKITSASLSSGIIWYGQQGTMFQ